MKDKNVVKKRCQFCGVMVNIKNHKDHVNMCSKRRLKLVRKIEKQQKEKQQKESNS